MDFKIVDQTFMLFWVKIDLRGYSVDLYINKLWVYVKFKYLREEK